MTRSGRAWVFSAAVLFGALGLGCAGAQKGGEMGEDCYRDEDCKFGLVCVANAQSQRVCSNDVTSLASSVEGPPPDAGAPTDDAAAPEPEPAPEDTGM